MSASAAVTSLGKWASSDEMGEMVSSRKASEGAGSGAKSCTRAGAPVPVSVQVQVSAPVSVQGSTMRRISMELPMRAVLGIRSENSPGWPEAAVAVVLAGSPPSSRPLPLRSSSTRQPA